jgi:hypothetical protein
MRNNPIIILSIFISIILLSNCEQRTKKNDVSFEEIKKRLGSALWLPKDLDLYNIDQDTDNYKQSVFSSEIKIVSYINGNCDICISDLKKWQDYIDENYPYKELTIIFYVHADDPHTFKYINNTYIHSKFPMFLDSNNYFFRNNKLSEDKILQTFLLDKEGNVILVGNPLFSEELKVLYKNEILKRLKTPLSKKMEFKLRL